MSKAPIAGISGNNIPRLSERYIQKTEGKKTDPISHQKEWEEH
jgi:hypothetical protein